MAKTEQVSIERSNERPTRADLIAKAIETINTVRNPIGMFLVVKGDPDTNENDVTVRQVFNTADARDIYTTVAIGFEKAVNRFTSIFGNNL